MINFKKQFNPLYRGYAIEGNGEINHYPSQTIPDQSMSVAEIMRRFAAGLPIAGQKVPVYEGEDNDYPPNWEQMDISEKHEFVKHNIQNIQNLQNELNSNRKQAEKAKREQEKKAIEDAAIVRFQHQQSSKPSN